MPQLDQAALQKKLPIGENICWIEGLFLKGRNFFFGQKRLLALFAAQHISTFLESNAVVDTLSDYRNQQAIRRDMLRTI